MIYEDEKLPVDLKLPYGADLKIFLRDSAVTGGNINTLLRSRGVFIGTADKHVTIPILTNSYILPSDFETLKELQNTREDRVKRSSKKLTGWTTDKDVIDCLPVINMEEIAQQEYRNYEIVGLPEFYPVDGNKNKARIDITIRKVDNSQDWINSRKEYSASVTFERKGSETKLDVVSNTTSKDSVELTGKVVRYIQRDFKAKSIISDEEESIKFGDFDNSQRIDFLFGFTKNLKDSLYEFERISHIDIVPDEKSVIPDGSQIQWMKNNINRIQIDGNSIENLEFINESSCKPYLVIWKIEADFTFDSKLLTTKGSCRVCFEFVNYGVNKNKAAIFSISVVKIKNKKITLKQKKDLEIEVLNYFDDLKENILEETVS